MASGRGETGRGRGGGAQRDDFVETARLVFGDGVRGARAAHGHVRDLPEQRTETGRDQALASVQAEAIAGGYEQAPRPWQQPGTSGASSQRVIVSSDGIHEVLRLEAFGPSAVVHSS